MRAGIAGLVLAYGLSQFYRAFLAVLVPDLQRDLGATAQDLAWASGLWFLAFAAMQVPVGWALDRVGPRATSSGLLAVAAGGAAAFASAQEPWHLVAAMALIGAGCASVLMASYLIFARVFAPKAFATWAGLIVGLGSMGNLAGSAPFAALADVAGWRGAMAGLAAVTLGVAALLWALVRDPPAPPAPAAAGGFRDLLRVRALWPVLLMMAAAYGPAAALRGLWAGPLARDVYGLDAAGIGRVTLAMALAMIAGSLLYGPADRLLGTRKGVVWGGNALVLLALLGLAWAPGAGLGRATALLCAAGLFGASFPVVMAHGRAFVPAHLTGRGVTLVNLFGIGGAGALQLATGPVHAAASAAGGPEAGFRALFLMLAGVVALGLGAYALARDRTD